MYKNVLNNKLYLILFYQINLSHNRIGFLTKKMFPASPWIPYRLMEIDLSHNELPVVTFDLTVGAKKVKKLNLAGNYINDIRSSEYLFFFYVFYAFSDCKIPIRLTD